ncbi:MAG: hypothetical protein Q9213_000782 [Squamulea squamosa]
MAEAGARKAATQNEVHQPALGNDVQDEARAISTVKNKIYAYLLDVKHARSKRTFVYNPRIQNGQMNLLATNRPFQLCTAILRVNKQIHSECISTLYRSNLLIRLSLYNDDIFWTQSFLEGTEMGFLCSNHNLTKNLTKHALDVKLIQEASKQLRCQVVFSVLYLPQFIRFLQSMCDSLPKWGQEHAIHLHLRHKYCSGPGATERILLDPWRNLHGISDVVVGTSAITPEYANNLRTAMMSNFEPENWLHSLIEMKAFGSEKYTAGNIHLALETYRTVIATLESVYRSNHGKSLICLPSRFGQEVNSLRFQCELNLVACYLKHVGTLVEALLAADNAVDLSENNEIDRVWTASAPRKPFNDKSSYTDLNRSKVYMDFQVSFYDISCLTFQKRKRKLILISFV